MGPMGRVWEISRLRFSPRDRVSVRVRIEDFLQGFLFGVFLTEFLSGLPQRMG